MALTNQQVQAAYLAITGRPAEGSAVTWASASFADVASLVSSIIDIRKGGDFSNNKETFVENLYQNLLGRASDAEGKEFWLKALNDGASYAQVAQNFINVVLGQSQTEDLYKLQNKLGIAEQISAQINTFQGGAAAEATLKALMSTVNANTTFANVEDSVKEFKGQNVDITTVTVQQGAEEPAKGSDEHATVFNATLDVTADGGIAINGSKNFAETLNLTIKGDADTQNSTISSGNELKDIKDVDIYNISADNNVKQITLNVGGTVNPKEVSITGQSNDKITVVGVATVKTGNGDDEITVTAATGKKVVVNGGNGTDTVKLGGTASGDFTKLSLTSIEKLEGKGILSSSTLDKASYTLADSSALTVVAKSGIDLSNITLASGSASIAINDVKSGTVTLSDKNAGIAEKITLKAGAAKVTINSFGTGDKLDIKAIGASGAAKYDAQLILNKLSFFKSEKTFNEGTLGDAQAASLKELITNSDVFTTSAGQKAYVAISNAANDTTNIYELANADNTAKITAGDTLKLIATIDSAVEDNTVFAFS